MTALARKWCPANIHSRGLDPRNLMTPPAHCQCDRLVAAVHEALEEQLQALEKLPLEYPTEPAAIALPRMIAALRGGTG